MALGRNNTEKGMINRNMDMPMKYYEDNLCPTKSDCARAYLVALAATFTFLQEMPMVRELLKQSPHP